MWALPSFVWDCLRTIHSSLGLKREAVGLVVSYLLFRFYEPAKAYLSAQGFRELPDVHGESLAAAFAGSFLLWHLLRHAVALEHRARPKLSLRILDPSQRYDTYVALGNRLLRLYHLEVENHSNLRTAARVAVSLKSYRLTGDRKVVDIRSKLKVANSSAEEIDLKPWRAWCSSSVPSRLTELMPWGWRKRGRTRLFQFCQSGAAPCASWQSRMTRPPSRNNTRSISTPWAR